MDKNVKILNPINNHGFKITTLLCDNGYQVISIVQDLLLLLTITVLYNVNTYYEHVLT